MDLGYIIPTTFNISIQQNTCQSRFRQRMCGYLIGQVSHQATEWPPMNTLYAMPLRCIRMVHAGPTSPSARRSGSRSATACPPTRPRASVPRLGNRNKLPRYRLTKNNYDGAICKFEQCLAAHPLGGNIANIRTRHKSKFLCSTTVNDPHHHSSRVPKSRGPAPARTARLWRSSPAQRP